MRQPWNWVQRGWGLAQGHTVSEEPELVLDLRSCSLYHTAWLLWGDSGANTSQLFTRPGAAFESPPNKPWP